MDRGYDRQRMDAAARFSADMDKVLSYSSVPLQHSNRDMWVEPQMVPGNNILPADSMNELLTGAPTNAYSNDELFYPEQIDNIEDEEAVIEDFEEIDNVATEMPIRHSKVPIANQVGIYGWRKKIIYLLIAVIVFLVALNMALTFWIVSFLGFTSNGISGLDLAFDMITFKGNAIFKNLLFASEIRSQQANLLKFTTYNGNISFRSIWNEESNSKFFNNQTNSSSVGKASPIGTKLTLAKGKVMIETNQLQIHDKLDRLMFALDSQNKLNQTTMTVRVDRLNIEDSHGLTIPLSLQTSMVESATSEELRIISPQGRLLFRGPRSVAIESKLGDTSIVTFGELRFKSNGGKITFESANSIYIRKLTLVDSDPSSVHTTSASKTKNKIPSTSSSMSKLYQTLRPKPEVFQLCICDSGKLFIAKPDSICAIQSRNDC